MSGRSSVSGAPRWRRTLFVAAAVVVGGNALLWAGHEARRREALEDLAPLREQIRALEAQIIADDEWIARNQRLLQGYGGGEELARRLAERGRRVRAHAALVDAHNRRLREVSRRFYLVPGPPPDPELLEPRTFPLEGSFPTPSPGNSPT